MKKYKYITIPLDLEDDEDIIIFLDRYGYQNGRARLIRALIRKGMRDGEYNMREVENGQEGADEKEEG